MTAQSKTTRQIQTGVVIYGSVVVLGTIVFQMLIVAMGWLAYDISRSPIPLGIIGLIQFFPSLLLFLVFGRIADIYERRKIVILARLFTASGSALLFVLLSFHQVSLMALYFTALLLGLANTVEGPAAAVLLSDIVGVQDLARSVARISSLRQLAKVAGPALGGLLYTIHGDGIFCFGIATLLSALSVLLLGWLRIPEAENINPRNGVGESGIFSGLRYVWRQEILFSAMSLDLVAVFFGSVTILLPIFAKEVFHTDAFGLGILRSAPALGSLLMASHLSRNSIGERAGRKLICAVAIFGIATCVFAFSRKLPFALLTLMVIGAANSVSVITRQTLVQVLTPLSFRGRVVAVSQVFTTAANQLGDLESGFATAYLGLFPTVFLGGATSLLVAVAWFYLFPKLRSLGRITPSLLDQNDEVSHSDLYFSLRGSRI